MLPYPKPTLKKGPARKKDSSMVLVMSQMMTKRGKSKRGKSKPASDAGNGRASQYHQNDFYC